MARVHRQIVSGCVLEEEYYYQGVVRNVKTSAPNPRFKTEEERERHRTNISRNRHTRLINENFDHTGYFWTLTFAKEVTDYEQAVRIRDSLWRKIRRKYPKGIISWYIGKGHWSDKDKEEKRIHFHVLTKDIPPKYIDKLWTYGPIRRCDRLREHNIYEDMNGNRVDHGEDYTGLANYLFDHWTEELGQKYKHRYKLSRNAKRPETKTEEISETGKLYFTPNRPPRTPKGYKLVDCHFTKYGFIKFKYVIDKDLQGDLLPDARSWYRPPEIFGDGEFIRAEIRRRR